MALVTSTCCDVASRSVINKFKCSYEYERFVR